MQSESIQEYVQILRTVFGYFTGIQTTHTTVPTTSNGESAIKYQQFPKMNQILYQIGLK